MDGLLTDFLPGWFAVDQTVGMPIYWPAYGNRTDAGLPSVRPFMAAPLSRQNTGYLPWVLLALLESPSEGREAAEGITDAPQDA